MRNVIVLASLLVGMAVAPGVASARAVKQSLQPTGVDVDAQGSAKAVIHGRHGRGKFQVVGRRLTPSATFGVSVGGVRIGRLVTDGTGSGTARFSNPRHGHDQLLGVDPRGKLIEVSDDAGEDVLSSDMPGDTEHHGDVQCCLASDGGTDCDETTADECDARGGTNMGAGSCNSNPCATTPPPPPEEDIRCCKADDDDTECDETTATECDAEGGTNMGAGSCFPNPCATMPPPPSEEDIRCCKADDDDAECDESSAAECAAEGGVNLGPGSCDPNPCAPTPPDVVRCCLADHEDDGEGDEEGDGERHARGGDEVETPECRQLTAEHCRAAGGTVAGPGSCDPNPCLGSPGGAFLD